MQQIGGLDVFPVAGELTYGLERLAMYLQGKDNVYDLAFNDPQSPDFKTYGDVFLENERQFSAANFEVYERGGAEAAVRGHGAPGAALPGREGAAGPGAGAAGL